MTTKTTAPLPRNPERTVALRKLLEAKDAAVRALLATESGPEHIMQFFAYAHLPPHLQEVSKPFCDLARRIVDGEVVEDSP